MLTYKTLKDKAKDFLAATGLKLEEFANLLPAFEAAYVALYPTDQTAEGKVRQRQPGGGTKGTLQTFEDKLLFILVYSEDLSVANPAWLAIWTKPAADPLRDSSAAAGAAGRTGRAENDARARWPESCQQRVGQRARPRFAH
jgi:hypothetical protein